MEARIAQHRHGMRQVDVAHLRRHAQRQVGGAAAVAVIHHHVQRQLARIHLRAGRRHQAAGHHRQAELLDAERTRLRGDLLAAQQADVVDAQLGVVGNLVDGLGIAPVAPLERKIEVLVRAFVLDAQRGRQRARIDHRQSGQQFATGVALHRERLAGAQQRAIHHRVEQLARHVLAAARRVQVEAPRLDAFLPRRPHEGHVGAALRVGLARADEIAVGAARLARPAAVAAVLAIPPFEFRQLLVDAREALRIGLAAPDLLAPTVGHLHRGTRHRLALVQRRDPRARVDRCPLEMHCEVRDQHAGAHVHRRLAIEQRLAQARRLDLDDVVARLRQRDADHLERMRLGLRLGRQLHRVHMGRVVQQTHAARLDGVRILRVDVGVVGVLVLFLLRLRAAVILGLAR